MGGRCENLLANSLLPFLSDGSLYLALALLCMQHRVTSLWESKLNIDYYLCTQYLPQSPYTYTYT